MAEIHRTATGQAKYLEEDRPGSVEDQTQWLAEAGFEDVGCHWRYLNFAIIGGRKPRA
jgi:tRNA (cmo5U34)-methyltransferase